MNLASYLASRGVAKQTISEVLPYYITAKMQEMPADDFCDEASIMDPDRWFYWPGQTRFVLVGQCPNGDGAAIDTEVEPGGMFYVAHELLGGNRLLEEVVIRVADSPSDYVQKRGQDDFPGDYWEAKANEITGANAGGLNQLLMRTHWAARVVQFWR